MSTFDDALNIEPSSALFSSLYEASSDSNDRSSQNRMKRTAPRAAAARSPAARRAALAHFHEPQSGIRVAVQQAVDQRRLAGPARAPEQPRCSPAGRRGTDACSDRSPPSGRRSRTGHPATRRRRSAWARNRREARRQPRSRRAAARQSIGSDAGRIASARRTSSRRSRANAREVFFHEVETIDHGARIVTEHGASAAPRGQAGRRSGMTLARFFT